MKISKYGYKFGWELEATKYGNTFGSHPNGHRDQSGPWEVPSNTHSIPKDIFDEYRPYKDVVIWGNGKSNRTSCGNHLHFSVNESKIDKWKLLFYVYDTACFFTPFFIPFYAGSEFDTTKKIDYQHRDKYKWYGRPTIYDSLDSFNCQYKRTTAAWVTKTNECSHRSAKPHIEIRLPEAVPTSSFTALGINIRIGEAFFENDYKPSFSYGLINIGERVIHSYINTIKALNCELTRDKKTAEILSSVFKIEIKPSEEYSLKKLLRGYLKRGDLWSYEVFWVRNVLKNLTYSKMLSMYPKDEDKMILSNKLLRTKVNEKCVE